MYIWKTITSDFRKSMFHFDKKNEHLTKLTKTCNLCNRDKEPENQSYDQYNHWNGCVKLVEELDRKRLDFYFKDYNYRISTCERGYTAAFIVNRIYAFQESKISSKNIEQQRPHH